MTAGHCGAGSVPGGESTRTAHGGKLRPCSVSRTPTFCASCVCRATESSASSWRVRRDTSTRSWRRGCKDLRASRSARLSAFGATLQEIGDLFGVTRERIRQILSKDTPWSSTDLSAAAKSLARSRRMEHAAAAEHWSLTHPAACLDGAQAALGISVEQVRQLLGRRRSRHEPAFDAPRKTTRRTEAEIIEDLRALHA